jgi:hypothetical protein
VFHGRVGVFGLNPEVPAAATVVVAKIDRMTRKW